MEFEDQSCIEYHQENFCKVISHFINFLRKNTLAILSSLLFFDEKEYNNYFDGLFI